MSDRTPPAEPSLTDLLFRAQAITATLPDADRDFLDAIVLRHLDDRAREAVDAELAAELSRLTGRSIGPRTALADLGSLLAKPDVRLHLKLRNSLVSALLKLGGRGGA